MATLSPYIRSLGERSFIPTRLARSPGARARLQAGALMVIIRERVGKLQQAWREEHVSMVFNSGVYYLSRLIYPWKFGLVGVLAMAAMQPTLEASERMLRSVREISAAQREQASARSEIANSVEAIAQIRQLHGERG